MNRPWRPTPVMIFLTLVCLAVGPAAGDYVVVDTGQDHCYDDRSQIACPAAGQAFYGQDAQLDGNQPSYTLSADGLTVHDNATGLTWTQSPDLDRDGRIDAGDKLVSADAQNYLDGLNAQDYGGTSDWRVPTIKELYSLIDFRGMDPPPEGRDTTGLVPFIDTRYFAFAYGDTAAGERIIDAQFLSSTRYVGTVFGGQSAIFGVNFADGRIKGYPADKSQFVYFVSGGSDYGSNRFVDNGDGTVKDSATGLMWSQADSGGGGMNWQDALAWVQARNDENYLGHADWRLPNAKELQSIVDYQRSPDTTHSAAIDPIFRVTEITNAAGERDYPFYWTGTSHLRADGTAEAAVYLAFGRGLGSLDGVNVIDVHGAGCQRSDPKDGDPSQFPRWGFGPQGDLQRVFNFVRCVRDTGEMPTDLDPVPDVKVNGSDGPLSLSSRDRLTVTIELDAGAHAGEPADWWVLADTPFGEFHYNARRNRWLPGRRVSWQGPLVDLAPPLKVLERRGLPGGAYTVRFAVDLVRNGRIDPSALYEDSALVEISGSPAPPPGLPRSLDDVGLTFGVSLP